MRKRHSSIDGFVPRRFGGEVGQTPILGESAKKIDTTPRTLGAVDAEQSARRLGEVRNDRSIGRSDIDESLRDIDQSAQKSEKISRKERRKLRHPIHQKNKVRLYAKSLVIFLSVVLLALGGYLAFKFIIAGNNIFEGSIFDIFQSQPLKQDRYGRSNFLVLGTSEDDPGHGGADLTDSMLVASVDQKNKNIYMFSVPRDLYVQYGTACPAGYSVKINGYFSCSDDRASKEGEQNRLTKTQKLVGDVFGIDIQYGVHVNHTVIKEAVNAVGGIDVNIEGSNGAPGVLDRNFDWRCSYRCYLVKYDNGIHHLDGAHALYLSMARGDIAPTYGLANSNFDREKNQQKILMALKDKATSTGTITNVDTITRLVDSFGANMRTNIKMNELRTLMRVTSEVKQNDVHTISLFGNGGVVTTGPYNGQSVVLPSAGIYNYSEVRAFIRKNITNDPIAKEAAPIAVFNGTKTAGFAQTQADRLKDKGYNVSQVGNAPDGRYGKVDVYQIGSSSPETAKSLAKFYSTTVKKTRPPVPANGNIQFVIILGSTF